MSVETVDFDRDRAHVRATGDLDLSTGAALWAVLASHLSAGRKFLRLDVSGVTFIDAAALTGISQVHYDALERRGTLVLVGVRPRIARVLHLTGLNEVLFVSGPRADDDIPPSLSEVGQSPSTVWSSRSEPWTPPAAAPESSPARPDR